MLKFVSETINAGKTQLDKLVRASIPKSGYAGEFRARVWDEKLKYPLNEHERDDLGLTLHQATHINIEVTETEIIKMIFTSAHGKNCKDPNIYFEKLDSVKADGSFTPLKDAKTGKLLYDANGNMIPDPNKGGQYVAVLTYPRKIGKDIIPFVKTEHKYQAYIDEREDKLKQILENAKKYKATQLVKYVGNKDGE